MQARVSGAFSLQGLAQALTKLSRQAVGVVIGAALAVAVLHAPQAHADKLDDIKKAGVLRVGVFDANPPFGYADAKTGQPVGLDVDYAQEIANKLGVKLELRATNPANRVPLLTSGKVDIVAANFTITDERKKQIEFSTPYFASGLQFIAKKGVLKQPDDLKRDGIRLGVDKGTTQETTLRDGYPNARVIAYDDSPLALTALRTGAIQAFAQDGAKLGALLATLPNRSELEISPFVLTREYMGIGVPKGETKLTATIDQILQGLEKDGSAGRIYDRWFGPKSAAPLPRDFIIGSTK
ncbi:MULTISPECIES: ABC transporter substrate-binding protein [Ralstonia]|jgi:polar amino acid transport system substrate-binding protein|uniref:Amino acid ABC transporter substrate-binding protein, PAAT family n=2 Tax=Pseudomonadota TaxID=1224 RepID=R0EBJ5_RALPI|nr:MULTISPECIES: ABC transporter substrate-binding protein [Ralstonia]MEA3267580.1 ABC transporter substrate-binding protein [Pseudomonadota bacterium]ENZ79484.1 amino acid ABC transporter substrate-binding protein, PAAT family [Ralstonia pickettii OR214]MBL4778796.1 ABC transporter substrate-binding protein [Ralstonia sp.]MCM3580250.1 ABC transporter substrate-binding protein [Ralstonia pickettii]MDR9385292.1 ABC transporter substrate-binding protein [Ralstonia sp. 11b]